MTKREVKKIQTIIEKLRNLHVEIFKKGFNLKTNDVRQEIYMAMIRIECSLADYLEDKNNHKKEKP